MQGRKTSIPFTAVPWVLIFTYALGHRSDEGWHHRLSGGVPDLASHICRKDTGSQALLWKHTAHQHPAVAVRIYSHIVRTPAQYKCANCISLEQCARRGADPLGLDTDCPPLSVGRMHPRGPYAGQKGAPNMHVLACICSNVRQFQIH